MKARILILGCLLGAVVLFIDHGYSETESKADTLSSEIGIVSIQKIFQDSKRGSKYRAEAFTEQQRVKADLEELGRQVEAGEAGLRALKAGSSDYMAQVKELLEKRANYLARQELYKQLMELTDQLWTKQLYQDILRVTGEVAKEKHLKLVLREDAIDFSETNITELGLAMRTHKLLYSGGCLDITDEVIAQLDAED
ncbi:MAG: OmpH family outer membrane protein [Planctomycetota bacterium]|nr:MAG: OmpH family outer membrane protein [Planctomycetota bacterium]